MSIWETIRGALIWLCVVMITFNALNEIETCLRSWWKSGKRKKEARRKEKMVMEAIKSLERDRKEKAEREAFYRADIGHTFIYDGKAYIKTGPNSGLTRDFKHYVYLSTPQEMSNVTVNDMQERPTFNEMRKRAGLEPIQETKRPAIEILLEESTPFWNIEIGCLFIYNGISYVKIDTHTAQRIGERLQEGFSLFEMVKPIPLHKKTSKPETEIKRFKDIKIGGRFEHNGENFIKVNTWRSRSETHTDLWYEFPQTLKVKAYKEDK